MYANVVGFCGIQGIGKSTSAIILDSIGFNILSFAKPLKDMLLAIGLNQKQVHGTVEDKNKIFNFIYSDTNIDELCFKMINSLGVDCKKLYTNSSLLSGCTPNEAMEKLKICGIFKDKKTTSRILMQLIGTEWGRNLHPDFWTNILMQQIRNKWKTNSKLRFVIDDVRFPNEVAMIKEVGGITIRLYNENEFATTGITNHASEQGHLLKVNANLYNDKKEFLRLRNSLIDLLQHIG
jgi:hypothetical protein